MAKRKYETIDGDFDLYASIYMFGNGYIEGSPTEKQVKFVKYLCFNLKMYPAKMPTSKAGYTILIKLMVSIKEERDKANKENIQEPLSKKAVENRLKNIGEENEPPDLPF